MSNGADGSIVIDTELDSSGFTAGSRQMLAAAGRLTQQITSQGRTMEQNLAAVMRSATSLGSALGRISNASNAGLTSESQVERFSVQLDTAREKLAEIEAEMARVGEQKSPTPEYTQLEKQLDKAYGALGTLQQRMEMMQALGVDENSQSYKRLCIQLDDAKMNLDALIAAQREMIESGSAYTSGKDTERYAALAEQVKVYKAAIDEFAGAEAQARSEIDAEAASEEREAVSKAKASSETRKATRHNHLLASALKAVAKAAQRVPSAASNMVGGLKKFLMISTKSTNASASLIKGLTGLGRMLKTRIKRMFISEIFKSLSAGINNLRGYSSAFNASVGSMKNSLTGLSGNIAVAASNLVNALAPAIVQIIDWISTAISYINAFFALISGRGTFTRAKSATDAYTRSLQGAGGAAQELKNQVYGFDELNKEQDKSGGGGGSGGNGPEFEDVGIDTALPENILNLFNTLKEKFLQGEWNELGQIIGSALNIIIYSVNDWIKDVLQPAAVTWSSNIAKVFNGLVDGIDWSALGTLFANGLNVLTESISTFVGEFDWVSLGSRLGTGANALVENTDWQALGTAITAKAKIVWETIAGFATSFDWATLGESIASGANAAFGSIDWETVATGVGAAVMGIWTAVTTALSQFDWVTVGTTIGSSINTLFAAEGGPIDWAAAATSLNTALLGIINGISAFLKTVNWKQIGEDIATFVASIDWSALATALVGAIGTALGGLYQALVGLIESAWTQVEAWWTGIMKTTGGNVWAALLVGLVSALGGIGEWITNNIVLPFVNGIRAALGLDELSESDLFKMGADIWASFTAGISNAWTAVTTWVKTNIVDPFVEAIKNFFGIASPSTVMAQIGGFLIQGLLNGISDVWNTLTTWLSGVLDGIITAISDAWTSITTAASTAWQGIKNTVMEWWTKLAQAISSFLTGMKAGIGTGWDAIKTAASTAWQGIKTTVVNWWNKMTLSIATGLTSMQTALSGAWTSIKNTASTGWTNIKTTVTTLWNSLALSIATGLSSMQTALSGAWTAIKTSASTGWTNIKAAVTSVWNSLSLSIATGLSSMQTGLSSAWTAIKTTALNGWEAIKKTITGLWDELVTAITKTDWVSIGANILGGIKQGILNGWDSFSSWVVGKFNGIVNGVKKTFGIHSPSKVFAEIGDYCMQGLQIGFDSDADGIVKTVEAIARDVSRVDFGGDQMIGVTVADNIDTAAEKLSGVASIFASIADSIERMGGLDIPSIAAGGVLPYQARVEMAPGEATQVNAEMERFSANFDETMTDQLDVLQSILVAIRGLNLTVDGNSLTRAITAMQRANARAYGGA